MSKKFTSLNRFSEKPAYAAETQEYILSRTENGIRHLSYEEEQNMFAQIRLGNLDALKQDNPFRQVLDMELIGKMADVPLKQLEYTCCSFITLATRAAIEGGLDANTAYAMSDVYLQHLAKHHSPEDILQLLEEGNYSFTKAVHSARAERVRRSYIEQAKNYIMSHLNRDFSLEDIAKEIGINASYLSRKFKEYESLSITQYTQQKRIQAARNMLKYSGESISSIANYLCFHSQSYFGAIFREHTGLSPRQYREQEQVMDFIG